MTSKMLSKVGTSLVRRFGTRDPFQIAGELGISVLLCEDFGSLKGMYRVIKRNRFIFLNKDLGDRMLRIVCAHELGHDRLHRKLAQANSLHEFMLYDMTTRPEYEANIVAAEILIDNEELLDYIYTYQYSAEQIAKAMDTDINLVALKIAHLTELGYDLRPVNHRSDFFKVVAKVLLGRGFSMKYKLYRSFGNLDKDVRRHELVAVEYGTNLEAVTDALIHAVSDDLAGTPEYASYKTAAFAPAPVKEFRRVRRYDYEMTGIVYPPYADKNILIDYGIIEESELEK